MPLGLKMCYTKLKMPKILILLTHLVLGLKIKVN